MVEGIARRGDVTIPEFHVFAAPRGSEVFRLIFPEGEPEWPGIVLVATALAVVAEGLRLAVVGYTPSHILCSAPSSSGLRFADGMSCQVSSIRALIKAHTRCCTRATCGFDRLTPFEVGHR